MLDISWNPEKRQLRTFGLIGAVVFAGLGAWVVFRHTVFGLDVGERAARIAGAVLWGLAAYCLVAAAARPRALRPLYVFLTALTMPIGVIASWTILGVIYFLIMTPLAIVFRVIGRDAMNRRFDPDATTYWVERPPTPDVARYFGQF